jgi:hypothetical protein
MQITPEQPTGGTIPPQPHMGQQQMQGGNQMHQDMGMDQERQKMDSQDNYMSRQFVPQSRMGNQTGPSPPQGAYDNEQFQGHGQGQGQGQFQEQPMPVLMPRGSETPQKMHSGGVPDASEMGIFQLLMSQSKMLSILFALLLCVQLETTQGLFRKVIRMVKVPEGMVFTASKVFAALVGVIIFFFVYRNL